MDGTNRYVYVVKPNQIGAATIEKRPIEVGIADATSFEVVSGLTQDDLVALPGDTELRDGMPVKIISTADNLVRGQKSED